MMQITDPPPWLSTKLTNQITAKYQYIQESRLSNIITGTTKWNKQHGSKSANYNLETWPFEPAEESMCFLRGLLQYMWMEAKNINDSCIFDLQWRVIAVRGSSSKEIVGRWQITAFVKEICLLGVVCKVFNRKTLSGETFCYQN